MSARPRFHFSGWLAGSFFSLLVANFLLILLVAGVDVLLGQPPQFMEPLFGLLIVSSTLLIAVHRRKARAAEVFVDDRSEGDLKPSTKRRRKSTPQAPAYHSMIIIKRPSVYAASPAGDEWKGTIQ
jgi:hypothetical protein